MTASRLAARVLRLDPIPRVARSVGCVSLRFENDPFELDLARMKEDGSAVVLVATDQFIQYGGARMPS